MRRIGTHSDGSAARRFCDYLLTCGIDAIAENDQSGQTGECDIWVRNEEDVERARSLWAEFQENPGDARYDVQSEVAKVRDQKVAEHQARVERHKPPPPQPSPARYHRQSEPLGTGRIPGERQSNFPVTIGIIVLSVIASLASHFAHPRGSQQPGKLSVEERVFSSLSFVDPIVYYHTDDAFASVKDGQWWRFITPMFLHGDELHLAFNMLWVFFLGSNIERLQGSAFLIFLVLVTQSAGMLLQVMLPDTNPWIPGLTGSPFAVGASGAVYGLFGYLWIRPTLDPRYPIHLVPLNIILMMAWLFLCMTPAVQQVANGAHVGGLVGGIAVAVAVVLARR